MNGSVLSPLTGYKVQFGYALLAERSAGLAPKVARFYAALQRPVPVRAARPRNHRPHRRPNRVRRLRGR